eukprot:scaffold313805_cov36-Tisochrysis_lutea.AAC.2
MKSDGMNQHTLCEAKNKRRDPTLIVACTGDVSFHVVQYVPQVRKCSHQCGRVESSSAAAERAQAIYCVGTHDLAIERTSVWVLSRGKLDHPLRVHPGVIISKHDPVVLARRYFKQSPHKTNMRAASRRIGMVPIDDLSDLLAISGREWNVAVAREPDGMGRLNERAPRAQHLGPPLVPRRKAREHHERYRRVVSIERRRECRALRHDETALSPACHKRWAIAQTRV